MFKESNGAVTFMVHVVPRANKNQIVGTTSEAVKIRLHAPPVEGKANDALIEFLADWLGVRRAQIEIVTGHTARRKLVRLRGVSTKQIEAKLK